MTERAREASLRFDAEVRCLDGRCGRMRRIVLDPRNGEVTHLVIRIGGGRDVVLPMSMVGHVSPEAIALKVSTDDLRDLPDYISTDYCLPTVEVEHPYGQGCAIMPLPDLGVFNPGPLPIEHHQIPPGDVELKEGSPVFCTDGDCGRIDQLLIDPENDRATGFVVRKGFFFARDVSVPLSWVSAVDLDGVHLKATREQLSKLERNWP